MLEVIAGDDGYDPAAPKVQRYSELLVGGVKAIKIGVVHEGFEQATAEATVSEKVRDAASGSPIWARRLLKWRSPCIWSGRPCGHRSAPRVSRKR
jgi:hypothetical protein